MTDPADPAWREGFLVELAQLYIRPNSSELRACEKGALRSHFSRLCTFDFRSLSAITNLFHARAGNRSAPGGPLGAPQKAIRELMTCVAAILRRAWHTPREASVYCIICESLNLFLCYFPHASVFLIDSPPFPGALNCPRGPHGSGTFGSGIAGDSIDLSLMGALLSEAEGMLGRCSLGSGGPPAPPLQGQQTTLKETGRRQEASLGPPSCQYASSPPLSDVHPPQGTSGDGSAVTSLESQDPFQRPRPLKRRAPPGSQQQGPQGLHGSPTADKVGVGGASECPTGEVERTTAVGQPKTQLEAFHEELLLCCCSPPPSGGGPSVSSWLQWAAMETRLLQQLLQLLLRLCRALQVVQATLASAAGVHALGLRARQSQLLQTWRPQDFHAQENNGNSTAEAAALATYLSELSVAFSERLDSFWPLKELLRPPLRGTVPPMATVASLQSPTAETNEGGGGPRGARGKSNLQENVQGREMEGPFPLVTLDVLRLHVLDLVAVLRQLCSHFRSGLLPAPPSESAEGPRELPQQGAAPHHKRSPMHEVLSGAAWLLGSEAGEAMRKAPTHWLFGPLVSHPYVHRNNSNEIKEGRDDATKAARALQAAAVRAFAAGGGAPRDGGLLLSPSPTQLGGPAAKDYTCLQDLKRTQEEEGTEDAEDQLCFEYGIELMQGGIQPELAGLKITESLYTSADRLEHQVSNKFYPTEIQTKKEECSCMNTEQDRNRQEQLLACIQQQHLAEDCLEILSRGWAPPDGQRGGPGGDVESAEGGGCRPLPFPPLTTTSLGPAFPLLLCTLEQTHAAGLLEDPSRDGTFLTSFFVEAKMQEATGRGN